MSALLLLAACAAHRPADSAAERGEDTARDPLDSGSDTAPDTGRDTAPDTGRDTAPDTGRDTAPDTSRDTAPDTGRDTAPDTGRDTASDTGAAVGGPCARYAAAEARAAVEDTSLDELSGLVVSRLNPGILWTHEDSGGAPELYAIDAATGETVTTLTLDGAENVDWEDLALAPCAEGWCLWVGDIGDLGAGRADFVLYTVPEPLLDGTPERSATPEARPFTYPDGPEDAEALFVGNDGLPYLVTKRADATAGLLRLDEGTDILAPLATLSTGAAYEDLTARVTAADLWGPTGTLLVRTYLHLYTFDLSDPTAPTGRADLPFALELQGEAVAWDPAGGFWQVSEAAGATLWYTGCAP